MSDQSLPTLYPPSEDEDTSGLDSTRLLIAPVSTMRVFVYETDTSYSISSSPNELLVDQEIKSSGDFTYAHFVNIEDRLTQIENEVQTIREDLDSHLGVSVVEVITVPKEQIKEKITNYVAENGDFWPDEFAEKFGFSVWGVLEAIDDLVEEGVLEGKEKDAVPRREATR